MEEINAPKKERKFLKAVGKVAGILLQEFILSLGRKFIGKKIDRIGNKRQALLIFLALFCNIAYASIDSIPYPITGNKQRLGWQTTGNGLVWRGLVSDTVTKPTNYADKNVKAYLILDSVSGSLYVFKQGVWAAISGSGGGGLTMPFDSITFNTAKDGTVGVGEVEYNDTQGSLIQGLKGGNVTNVIGQQLHQRVNNKTGGTLAKGTVVYLSGSQGNRITVAKALATTDPTSANTFGIVAEEILHDQSGYVITEGLITNINTSALTADSAVYLSGTTAGALTSTKPQAPIHGVYIGVCVKSNAGSGELFVKIRNGQELDELHDVQITSPVDRASLYFKSSEGLWRDTTAALLVSDTASMLANYATKAYADTTGRFYARQEFRNVSSSTLTWTQSDTLIVNDTTALQVYRNGQILLPNQYTVPTKTTVVIAATSYKAGENYTVIFPRGGGAGSGGGSGSLTSISAGTGITVSPNPITTTGTVSADLSVLMELADTSLLNLSTRFASKLNAADTASLSNRINAKGSGTVTSVATGYGLSGGTITTTGELRLDSATVYDFVRDSIVDVQIGNDTIKILKQEYNPALSDTLTWTVTSKFPIQLRAYILLFRNGQLLINDQYTIIDTNKIKVAASSYKVGENYTVVTVSGIGSVSSGQGNPVYPEAGIALSTGTTWTTSIPNNSTNWNTAYTDRLKWDGGSTGLVAATGRTNLGGTTIGQSMFTLTNPSAITFPQFNADNTITALSAASYRGAIGAGTVTSVTAAGTSGNPISITTTTSTPVIELLSATSGRNGYLLSTDWTTFNNKQNALSNASSSVSGILTSTDWTTFNNKQSALSFTLPLLNTSNTISINNAQEDGTTKGVSTYNGNDFNAMSGVITIDYTNAVSASSGSKGFLLPADWTTFNNKVTSVSGTGAISSTGGTTPVISVATAAFGTAGIVSTAAQQFSGDKTFEGITTFNARAVFKDYTYTATRLAGLSSTDRFATVTLGTGLSLSSGTLSATSTGTVTNVTGTAPISVANGTTTPSITIADASGSVSGVVNTTTQSFAGNKTFTGAATLSSTLAVTGATTLSTTTATPTSLLGKDGSNVVGSVTLGSSLTLSSGTLNVTASNTFTTTNANYTVVSTDKYIAFNNNFSNITVTLPSASSNTGRELYFRNVAAGSIISASNNVINNTVTTGTPDNSILGAGNTNYKWCTLVSNGTYWIKVQAN